VHKQTYLDSTLVSSVLVSATGMLELEVDGAWKPFASLASMRWNDAAGRYEGDRFELSPGGTYSFRFVLESPFKHVSEPRPVSVGPCPTILQVKTAPTVCGPEAKVVIGLLRGAGMQPHDSTTREPIIGEITDVILMTKGLSLQHEAKTDKNGEATFSLPFPEHGTYLLKASYRPERPDRYQASSVEKELRIGRSMASIVLNEAKGVDGGAPRQGEDVVLSGRLRDEDNRPIKAVDLNLKLLGKGGEPIATYTTSTKDDGTFKLSHPIPLSGLVPFVGREERLTLQADIANNPCYSANPVSLTFGAAPGTPLASLKAIWPYIALTAAFTGLAIGYRRSAIFRSWLNIPWDWWEWWSFLRDWLNSLWTWWWLRLDYWLIRLLRVLGYGRGGHVPPPTRPPDDALEYLTIYKYCYWCGRESRSTPGNVVSRCPHCGRPI